MLLLPRGQIVTAEWPNAMLLPPVVVIQRGIAGGRTVQSTRILIERSITLGRIAGDRLV
jgi:hypothetical protein